MVDDVATVWGGEIRLGRKPANNEILVGNTNGNFSLAASSSISPSIQTLLDGISTTQGSILYRDALAWVALSPGTAGNVLSTNGAGANPSWVAQTPVFTPTWLYGAKTSDQSINSTTTLTNVTGMSFSVAANTFYSFQFLLLINSISSGADISVTCPVSGTVSFSSPFNSNILATGSGTRYALFGGGPVSFAVNIFGYLSNGANAGTLQLQYSQNTSSPDNLTALKGSWFQYRTV